MIGRRLIGLPQQRSLLMSIDPPPEPPDGLVAVLRNEYTGDSVQRVVDQVVIEHGTIPNDGVYVELKGQSINDGEVDLDALIQITPQRLTTNPNGRYQLFRIGDAVAGRNIHSAMYDARRIALTI